MSRVDSTLVIGREEVVEEERRRTTRTERRSYRMQRFVPALEAGHHTGSDLLFVSDGLCPIPDEFVQRFREAKARYDLRMTSVLIGEEPLALGEISDTVHRLDEALQAGEALAAHFASAFLERGHEPMHAVRAPLRPGRGTPLLFDHFLPADDEA